MKDKDLNTLDGTVTNPMAVNGARQPIASVLRVLASGENCDGEPYDQMMQAAEYIEHLESKARRRWRSGGDTGEALARKIKGFNL